MSSDESDRRARLARLLVRTEEVLGTEDKAIAWLNTPNCALGGEVPLHLLDSDAGAVRWSRCSAASNTGSSADAGPLARPQHVGNAARAPGHLATHLGLAVLELLVHTEPALVPDDLVLWCRRLPDGIGGHRVAPASLSATWATMEECVACRGVGPAWLETGGLWLEVPSAVLPESSNVLLHSAMSRIMLIRERPFRSDARLL